MVEILQVSAKKSNSFAKWYWGGGKMCVLAIPRPQGIFPRGLGQGKMPDNPAKYEFAKYEVAKI